MTLGVYCDIIIHRYGTCFFALLSFTSELIYRYQLYKKTKKNMKNYVISTQAFENSDRIGITSAFGLIFAVAVMIMSTILSSSPNSIELWIVMVIGVVASLIFLGVIIRANKSVGIQSNDHEYIGIAKQNERRMWITVITSLVVVYSSLIVTLTLYFSR